MARKTAGASAQWFQELTNNDFSADVININNDIMAKRYDILINGSLYEGNENKDVANYLYDTVDYTCLNEHGGLTKSLVETDGEESRVLRRDVIVIPGTHKGGYVYPESIIDEMEEPDKARFLAKRISRTFAELNSGEMEIFDVMALATFKIFKDLADETERDVFLLLDAYAHKIQSGISLARAGKESKKNQN